MRRSRAPAPSMPEAAAHERNLPRMPLRLPRGSGPNSRRQRSRALRRVRGRDHRVTRRCRGGDGGREQRHAGTHVSSAGGVTIVWGPLRDCAHSTDCAGCHACNAGDAVPLRACSTRYAIRACGKLGTSRGRKRPARSCLAIWGGSRWRHAAGSGRAGCPAAASRGTSSHAAGDTAGGGPADSRPVTERSARSTDAAANRRRSPGSSPRAWSRQWRETDQSVSRQRSQRKGPPAGTRADLGSDLVLSRKEGGGAPQGHVEGAVQRGDQEELSGIPGSDRPRVRRVDDAFHRCVERPPGEWPEDLRGQPERGRVESRGPLSCDSPRRARPGGRRASRQRSARRLVS